MEDEKTDPEDPRALSAAGTLALQMGLPAVVRSDIAQITERIARYRGIRFTLLSMGFGGEDAPVQALLKLEGLLCEYEHPLLTNLIQGLTLPPAAAGSLTGHSTDDLKEDIARENMTPEELSAKAAAARNKYKRGV